MLTVVILCLKFDQHQDIVILTTILLGWVYVGVKCNDLAISLQINLSWNGTENELGHI